MKRWKILIVPTLMFGCSSPKEKPASDAEIQNRLTEVNRLMVRDEAKDIEDFIQRHQFKMTSNGTGLRVQVLVKGNGKTPSIHEEVAMVYSVYLLDGTLCYSAPEAHPLKFHLGEGQQPRGLEDALITLPEGSHARVIVPSHLAFGITGDGDKIPGASALYYEIHLLNTQP
ncbi:MAG: FKBP-type peptidyl-prolyl cis-trans isomerase [Bacteroidetes bacterium]|nr:FKBP-type peptidyl-prolyl cis-trans isomerase [Bacteroidota bacterium]